MRNNKTKHEILKVLLTEKKLHLKNNKVKSASPIDFGISLEKISKHEKITNKYLSDSITELVSNEEISENEKDGINIYSINEKGKIDFISKKYIRKNENTTLGYLRDFAQIVIPILAVSISFYLVKIQNKSDKELRLMKLKVKEQESTIKRLEFLHNKKVVYDKK
jgi:hypothetical protein